MILTSMPVHLLAANDYHNNLSNNKSEIINNETPVKVAKPEAGKTAADLIKNPDQPAIYTLRTDYKVQRGEKYDVNYQPYVASVGADASDAEKAKVKQTIKLPDLAGYIEPQDDFKIDYKTIFDAANGKGQTGDATNGIRYQANQDFKYTAKSNHIKIKHVFQDLEDFSKYTNPDGSIGEKGERITTQDGNTGSTMEVSPLGESDPDRKGFVPEAPYITMQVPENAENFILEYRYNRAHYDVVFDTKGGTALPARTLYYGQVIPKIADESIPTKVGGEFQGWKPSVDLTTKDGKTFKANEIIKVGTDASKNLDANLIMPASKVTFTAVWKDKEKADYAVQFWAEKADHADGASMADKYDYIGTRVYKDEPTGKRPDLANEPVKDIVFPDLDQKRLAKIWAGAKFNRGKDPYLNKFYVYNQALTADQNKDPENVNLVKSVEATGKTVYNIYYDRQVYDLYFTKSNALPAENTFYPEIWGYDETKDEIVKKGGPGDPYHYKARFNEMMYKWPNDAKQTKGFTPGYQSFGWGPNYTYANWPLHLDTPPYRLNADEFLDMANYTNWGGYTKKIDKGDGTSIDLKWYDYKILSFGIKQDKDSMPHHMDFWMDGFKKDETIIRYDLYRYKADTNSDTYSPKYPQVQGFTGKRTNETPEFLDSDGIDDKNDERAEVTPFPAKTYTDMYGTRPVGEMKFIKAFFNNGDEWGDPDGWDGFDTNGYLKFEYTRNKYPLRFNYDPSKIKGDNEFDSTNSLDTFYEFPLKALSPDVDTEESYKTENPKNILDNPEKLQELGLKDLVFKDSNDNNKLKVKRPENLSDQMVFKGWALDPAGSKLIWENPGEKMPSHPVNLYAKWGEPDYKWKVTFDPNDGSLRNIKEEDLTTSRKKIQEGDIGQEEINTYAKKEANDGNKQIFTVIQRQKLVEPKIKPTRKGYDFMGWEVIRYKKDATTGDYTNEQDTSYRDTYKVPELYSFGNDVVAPVYLKAIWVPNARVDVKVEHYMLDKDYSLKKKLEDTLEDKRANYLVATTGDKQDQEYILATNEELEEKLTGDLKTEYDAYNKRVGLNNTFFQTLRVEPAKKLNPVTNKVEENPDVKNNVFKFFYKPFRTRQYKVNYIDERFKGKENEKDGAIINQELVENGNRHYDARNYRPIPGWKLVSAPQQQLFFDVDEDTNEFKGINGTGKDEITFYYKDVRVIEVPENGKTPDGYVRVTFKAEKGGSFTDKDGKPVKELHYDVIKGLKSDLLPVPQELKDGEEKVDDKHYITPETGRKFTEWNKSPLLNKNTNIDEPHTFTAYFEWSGLSASGLVRTEAFKDLNGKWTNNFAPTLADLKKQLVWKEKDVVTPLPKGTEIKLYDEKDNELKTDEDIFKLVTEKNAADKDELVRTVKVKAKVTFKDGKEPQELDIPITVYKNVYEALTGTEKPLFLSQAEKGELKDITGDYVKVTVNPTGKPGEKDSKIYYVNKNAWVEIPEIELTDKEKKELGFTNWTADKDEQNEKDKEDKSIGVFDFNKRHKFTEDTVISPGFSKDVVPQTGTDKPKVPDNFVKVIVKTTDKATTESTQTFWVNPTKEVTIPVTEPTGKTDQEADIPNLGKKKVNYVFKEWQKVQTGQTDDSLAKVDPAVKIDLAKNQYTDKVTVIEAAYNERFAATPIVKPIKTEKLDTPEGKEITDKDLIGKITPPANKKIESITVVERPDPSKPGKQEAKVIVKYKDGSTQGTNDNPVVIPVEVHKNIIPEAPGGQRPKDALDNYVKVIFKAGTGGTVSGDTVYYVSPEVEVDLTESAGKITKTPDVGYVNGDWDTTETKKLKGTFKEQTEFTFKFTKTKDIVEKTDDNVKKPDGYITVTLIPTDKAIDATNKVYFVNPKAENVKITNKPEGKKETINGIEYTYVFNGWTVTKGTVASWTDENINGKFTQVTEITAKYSKKTGIGELIPAPVAKKNVVTPKGDTPKPEDLIENKTGLPEGTTFKYTNDGTPDVNNPGKTTAKVEVKYPNGKTVVVDVPITVVDNVVPQTGTDKPLVPESYVKVIVDTTDKATDNTYFVKTFWVNPNVEVKLPGIFAPNGKTDQEVEITGLGKKKVNYVFKEWQKVQTGEKDDSLTKVDPAVKIDLAKNKFTDKVTVIEASYNERFAATPIVKPIKTEELHTPEGKEITDKDLIGKITPPANKEIESITVVEKPDPSKPGKQEAKVTIKYKDGTTQGTKDKPVVIPVEVHKNIIPEAPGGQRPKDALDNYVKVIFKAGEGETVSGDLVYYVSPEVEVDMTESAGKITKKPDVGYISGDWDTSETKKLKATFTAKETEFTFNFKKTDDIVEKTDDPSQVIPEGYVKVTLIPTDKAKDAKNKVYFVNPKAKNVTITNKPKGKKETINGIEYTYVFNGWTVTKGTVASWANENINGQFTQETVIVAKYKTTTTPKDIEQIPEVVSEIPIVSLNQSDIDKDWFKIKNKNDNDSKITNVEITEKPATDSLGIQSGKAKVTFENGSSRIITIQLKVVDDVIETKDDKKTKDVPDNYKLVILDSTSDALEQTKRYFWINPDKDINLKAFKPQGKPGKVFDKWDRSLSINWNKEGITEEVLTIKAIYKDDNTPGGTTPGDKPGDKPGDNPGGTTPGDKPGDKPGDNPGGTTPGDKPGDKPGDNPGGTTPGGTTPGTNPETPGENPETPGTVPENPGAIPGTKPGVVEKHGNRYVERVAGKNRVHTAISTSKRFFKKSKYVIIADSGNYPDALTATVLAHVLDAPILLNNTRYLEDDVAREIVRLGASEVIIVGGHKSISENVKSQLAKYDANKVQRIWGRDRYVTSSELAYEIQRLTGKVNKAIIASGENFPDALATAPLGSKEIAPILLVTRNQMDKKVGKALKDLNIKRVYVAGGQYSVSKKLEAQLPQVIRRFSGQDRYETAILVASYTYPESKEVFVASGETFPDALVIGPVCARRKAPILLSKSTPVKSTDDYIEKSKIEYLYIIGGTNTIHVDTAHKYAIED